MLNRGVKIYLLLLILFAFSIPAYAQVTDFIIRHIAGNDSNVKTVGLTILGATLYEGLPAFVGPKFSEMEQCRQKYETLNSGSSNYIIIDTNDFCNAIGFLNDRSGKLVSSGYDYEKAINGLPPGLVSIGSVVELTQKEISNGILTDSTYFASNYLKDVPVLKNAFAQADLRAPTDDLVEQIEIVWKFTRNIAFSVLLIAALVTGISIMSSKAMTGKDTDAKIITAEKALPRVILAVILISSSYYIGDLTVRTLIGSGITQGVGKFVAASFIAETEANKLDFPLHILYYNSIINFAQSPIAVIVALFLVFGFVGAWIRFNLYVIMNIFYAIAYIIFAPLVIAQGALPSDMSGEAFKRYSYNLIYYISCGFMFSLIGFLAKAVLIMFQTGDGIVSPAKEVVNFIPLASSFLDAIYPILALFILTQVRRVTQISASFAERITGTKAGLSFVAPVENNAGAR